MYDFFQYSWPSLNENCKEISCFVKKKRRCVFTKFFGDNMKFLKMYNIFFCSSNGTSCYYWSKLSRFWYNGNGVVGDSRGDWIILRQSACGSFSLYPGSPGNFLLAKALTEKKKCKWITPTIQLSRRNLHHFF